MAAGLFAAQSVSSLVSRAEAAVVTDPTGAQALAAVAQFQGVWSAPPSDLSGGETTDAPLMGNGDVGVAVGGSINDQTFYVGKNDFFSTASNSIQPLGRIVLALPGMAGASYHVVQDIAQAQVVGSYALGGDTVATTSWVSATEGMFVTSITVTGSSAQAATVTLQDGYGNTPATSVSGGVLSADVAAGTSAASGNPQARMSATVLGGAASVSGNQLSLTLQPGTTYTLATAIVSSGDTGGYQAGAQSLASSLTAGSLASLLAAHESWWQGFWEQSFVQIPDQSVERSWYGSLYLLGSVARSGKYAPGLWGNWVTGAMNWNGDYHTNYDYEAAFYSALSTNHIAQMGAYAQPVLQYEANGQALASANGYTGVLYPVGIGPNGMTTDSSLHNQKSNAAYLASDMVMEYEYTRSASYAAQVLPFLEQVGTFWQNYLTADSSGIYHIYDDAPQEDDAYPQTDNAVSLALVRLLFQGLIDMSGATGQNASSIAAWQNIVGHLAGQPTTTVNGQTVFAETAAGAGFVNDGNDVDIQSVYPGGAVGLDSSAALLAEAQNTVGALTNAWHGGNAPTTFYAAAARVGYNPSTIMSNLDDEATSQSYTNMAVHHNGGGVENLNVTTSGLDEMLLQSFQNDVKVFPDWPTDSNAKYGDLLAYGDFLVSSSIQNNTVQYVQAASQAGGAYTFTNPWPGQSIEYYDNGTDEGTLSGTEITLSTTSGETIDLAPAGTSLSTIQTEMSGTASSSTSASGEFSTGFESGQPQPTWSDTVDTADAKGGGLSNVAGLCCGLTGPEAGVRTGEQAHTGTAALMYSGDATSADAHAYMQVYDLSADPLTVGANTVLSYWIYPQSNATSTYVPAGSTDSECVAVDMIFSDGSDLRDSGAKDQNGITAHPADMCGHLTLDTWNYVSVNLGAVKAGLAIDKILLGYDQATGASGGYRGYLDDLNIGYSTSFETGQPQPAWTDTVDTTDTQGGGISNVTGICCGLTGPETGVRTGEQAHTGTAALMYSGDATAADAHAYTQVVDLSADPLAVGPNTVLTYWIFPQSNATNGSVPAGSTDSECVAVDMIFSDGSDLRDSGAKDQNGITVHPADMCGHLTLDTWNEVTVNLGTVKNGLAIDKILLGYDQATGASGGYRGYIDDLSIGG
jgi:hypothetical protein